MAIFPVPHQQKPRHTMLRSLVTQKSAVCGVLALLWIWFLWVYVAQSAVGEQGHPHFEVVPAQPTNPSVPAHDDKKPTHINNEISPYDRPGSHDVAPSVDLQAGTPDHGDETDKAASGPSLDEPASSHDKPGASFDKPGTSHDGVSHDKPEPFEDDKPAASEDDGSSSKPYGKNKKPAAAVASSKSDRPLVIYAYAESEAARENLQFFLKKGLNGAADFVFMFNGETDAHTLVPDDKPNVRVVRRPNTCFDLGAMGEVLRKDDLWKRYTRFITMNASIRGPFMPVWSTECWMDRYLDRITDEVKLVGMSINCDPRLHVQSMIFATDKVGMSLLLDPALALSTSIDDAFGTSKDPVGLSSCYDSWTAAVHAEVGTTGIITAAGYRIDALLSALHSESSAETFCAAHPEASDFWWDNKYFGANVHPYETIFYKANRDVDTVLTTSLTEWHLKMKASSWDTCGSA